MPFHRHNQREADRPAVHPHNSAATVRPAQTQTGQHSHRHTKHKRPPQVRNSLFSSICFFFLLVRLLCSLHDCSVAVHKLGHWLSTWRWWRKNRFLWHSSPFSRSTRSWCFPPVQPLTRSLRAKGENIWCYAGFVVLQVCTAHAAIVFFRKRLDGRHAWSRRGDARCAWDQSPLGPAQATVSCSGSHHYVSCDGGVMLTQPCMVLQVPGPSHSALLLSLLPMRTSNKLVCGMSVP